MMTPQTNESRVLTGNLMCILEQLSPVFKSHTLFIANAPPAITNVFLLCLISVTKPSPSVFALIRHEVS